MENSAVYWSNWAGLSDVTSAMQVQRGLGSSKLAISSVGGTINVVTRSADMKEGGFATTTMGNDNYIKTGASYSTGKMSNGLSASVLFSQTSGNGYVNGTKFAGQNYFIGIGYELNKKHDFQFTITGAPQWHNQRSAAPKISDYIKYGNTVDPNVKYNSDYGYLNGQEFSFRTNYYHKPIASINWDYKINETTKLSTVVYGSWGRGGGSNGTGGIRGKSWFDASLKTADGLVNVGLINQWNTGQPVVIGGTTYTRTQTLGAFQNSSSSGSTTNLASGISKISSINSHNWYGGVIDLNKKLSKNLVLDFGVDVRTYTGIHFQNINNLLGATNYLDVYSQTSGDINNQNSILTGQYHTEPNGNPFFNSDYQEKINYNNDGLVKWYGAFTQLEYSSEKLTAFVQGSISQQGFKRNDYFKYLRTDALAYTDYKNLSGFNVKGGANYNINNNHNVYVNAGYYSKQPFFNAVYINNASLVNENLTNEKILGFEAGYGFRSSKFNANVNVYQTSWKDRFIRLTANIDHDLNTATNAIPGSAFLQGVEQIHNGVELDFTYKPINKLSFNGMLSFGNWKYGSNVKANYQDDNNLVITNPTTGAVFTETLYTNGLKVGDAAQTTASLGATYEIVKNFKVDGNYRYMDELYASIDPINFKTQAANDKGSLRLPGYGLIDAGATYKLVTGENKDKSIVFRLNVNNLLDEIYIAESRSNIAIKNQSDYLNNDGTPNTTAYNSYLSTLKTYKGLDQANTVFFGFGRTWNFSLSYNF